ncbi:MAG: signal peptide peptidase SppA [Bdellovibrionota bacterium]
MRLLTIPILLIVRGLGWLARKIFLATRGYNVVRLRLKGSLPDRHGAGGLLSAFSGASRGPTLLEVLLALDRARRDPRVKAVLVEVGHLRCGPARAEEIRRALARLRESGREVWIYFEEAGLPEYLVALGGSRIVLAPAGSLHVAGIASEVTFFKGLLDKAGVQAQLAARGKYKSIRETVAEPAMSEANREMTTALVSDLYEQLVAETAAHRKLDPAKVREILDEGPFLAEQARNYGLVDGTGYLDDLAEELEEKFEPYRPLPLGAYLRLSVDVISKGNPTAIALLEVAGSIKSGKSLPGPDGRRATGSRTFLKELERAAEDKAVKAILLRVNSPGGSGLASDLMWHALVKASKEKPVVVSMSDVAASGGYYVSAIQGTTILACDSTITGSIGVVGGKFSLAGLYEKLNIRKEIIRRGKHAASSSDAVPYTEEELKKLAADIDAFYQDFVKKMAEGRGKSFEEIDAVAQGRVWTGKQAREQHLADEQGGLLEALTFIRQRLDLPENAPLALLETPGERPRLPIRWEWNFSERPLSRLGIAEILKPLELARQFAGERVLAILPFEVRFF